MPELAPDHDQWDALAGHLDRMPVPELVGHKPAADSCRERGLA